eukprot:XP_011666342.1 PREDICTED: indoleamine 2,3-dioxygenase 2 [Strongylocentrotus purpuratus]
MAVPDPLDYDIHPKFGFVPENPARELPSYYYPWMTFTVNVQDYVHNRTIRDKIKELPLLDHAHLGDDVRLLRLAHCILTGLAQCYIWVDGSEGVPEILPRQIAVPLKGVSDKLNYPPSPMYHTSSLCNWKLKDPDGPIVPKNVETIFTMNGGEKESNFMTSTLPYEFLATEGLFAVSDAQKAVLQGNGDNLAICLEKLKNCLQSLKKSLLVVRDGCDPEHFYHKIKPFAEGWDSPPFHKKNLKGIVFEGVNDEPIGCGPLTAAQTPTLPVFDAALGIKHTPEEERNRLLLRSAMPPAHVRFIVAIENGPSIKDFVESTKDPTCKDLYNSCIHAIKDFRSGHVQSVTSYGVIPGAKKARDSDGPGGNQEKLSERKCRNCWGS